MPKSNAWSKPSPACRIELRASRQLAASLLALGVLGVVAWVLSDASPAIEACGSIAGLAWSFQLARREVRRPVSHLALAADGTVRVDDVPVDGFRADWRGSLVTLSWRADGRAVRRLAFPDALDRAARRELRLWALARREPAVAAAVAP